MAKKDVFIKYREMVHGLAPYASQGHGGELHPESLKDIMDVVKRTSPKNILEMGFFRGNSALMWLLASTACVHSIDIFVNKNNHVLNKDDSVNILRYEKANRPDAMISIEYLMTQFPNRFIFELLNSFNILVQKETEWFNKFDLIFIDANHGPGAVMEDTKSSITLMAKYILYDDYCKYGYMQSIIKNNPRLKIIKVYSPIKECEGNNGQCLVEVLPIKNKSRGISLIEALLISNKSYGEK